MSDYSLSILALAARKNGAQIAYKAQESRLSAAVTRDGGCVD
ncbi:hypothetical protein [Acidisphaera sp. S103]|nr:hypothetical protein [Acidisphaera sp. S103]